MSFINFYMQTTGSNLNAGSTTADAASLTYAGGTFVRATGVFTVASGNPSSDGVLVGDLVSIYTTSGATTATFVAQVTARDTTTITVSASVKWGVNTTVSETAAATTLKVGGAHAGELPWATMTGTVGASTKVNIKAGTYTIAASRTISIAGATTTPLWFSGYNTTPGDLDNDTTNSLAKPVWALNSTFALTTSGDYQDWSGLSQTANVNGPGWVSSSSYITMVRVRIENTNTGASARALNNSSGSITASYSWFKLPTAVTGTAVNWGGSGSTVVGCVLEGGGGFGTGSSVATFVQCVSLNSSAAAFSLSTGLVTMLQCTAYNPTGDALKWFSTPARGCTVVSCLFSNCGGYGINNSTGTNTANVFRSNNDFYSCTSGNENGFGDQPAFFGQTESSSPVVSSTNMTPINGSNARNNGFPGIFENQTFSNFIDIGAVDHADPTGGLRALIGMGVPRASGY